jgi:hypothetical protein
LILSMKRDNFNDFVAEKLIPYKVSTLGPAVAIGDLDGNGYEDLYIGHSSGKPGKLFMNSGSDFEIISPPVFEEDAVFEDNSAAFFDADADGDLDLYVGSGISSNNQSDTNKDRLYLYDNGKYVGSNMVIPDNSLVTSTVQPYDYDLDGDTDLFIGNLSDPKSFGKRVNSYLLRNNGNGTF